MRASATYPRRPVLSRLRQSRLRRSVAVVLLGLCIGGCSGMARQQAETPDLMAEADRLFEERQYEAAAATYQEWLDENGAEPGIDHVLFRQAVAYLSVSTGGKGTRTAVTLLRRLVSEFPASSYRPAAVVILGWRAQNYRLRAQLGELDQLRTQIEELEQLRAQIGELEQLRTQLEDLDRLRQQLGGKLDRLRSQFEEFDEIRLQLEELKRIDLSEPQDDPLLDR